MGDKKETRGAKKGRPRPAGAGRKAGVSYKPDEEKKNSRFLGYKFTEERAEELKRIFSDYKKRNGLSTTEAIERIILEKK